MFYKIISLLQWRRAGQGSPGAAASVLPQGPQEPEVRVPEQQPDCCGGAEGHGLDEVDAGESASSSGRRTLNNRVLGFRSGGYKFGELQDYALRILGLPPHKPVRGATSSGGYKIMHYGFWVCRRTNQFGGLQDSGGYKIMSHGFWVWRRTNGF